VSVLLPWGMGDICGGSWLCGLWAVDKVKYH